MSDNVEPRRAPRMRGIGDALQRLDENLAGAIGLTASEASGCDEDDGSSVLNGKIVERPGIRAVHRSRQGSAARAYPALR